MKVLLVSDKISTTATGIVAQRLIQGLSNLVDLYVLTSDSKNLMICKDRFFYSPKSIINPYLVFISFIIFKKNIFERKWGLQQLKTMPNFDLVISCVSYGNYSALTTSNVISKEKSCPHISYFVDAIPTPNEYVGDSLYLKVIKYFLKSFIVKQTRKVSIIYSTCLEMSIYQKNLISNTNIIFDELLNPVPYEDIKKLNDPNSPIFVFAGQVYLPRTPRYVLDAFALLLKCYPNSELHFIGTKHIHQFLNNYDRSVLKQIKVFDYTENIEEAYVNACALIDIGCEVENDVFMSSKLSGYICYNRPIICETSLNSAPRRIFKDDRSVLLCEHDAYQIFEGMKACIEKMGKFDFFARGQIIKQFSIDNVSKKLLKDYHTNIASVNINLPK